MSDNPYSPPESDLGTGPERAAVAGRGDFEIGQCLSDAWANTWENFPLWLGAGLVYLLATAASVATVIGIFLLVPVLTWGGVRFGLRMHDGDADFGDIFSGFSLYGTALPTMLVCIVAISFVGMAGQSLSTAGDVADNDLLRIVGLPLNLFVTFFVNSRLTFAYFYAVDRGLPGGEALRTAWEQTRRAKWKIVLLVLLNLAILLAGLAVFLVGVIPASVIGFLMWISAYRQLAGGPAQSPAVFGSAGAPA